MKAELREKILKELRTPSAEGDRLIEQHVAEPMGKTGSRPYTSCVETALTLLPDRVHFLCGRFEEGNLFWCDIGHRPQVQGWGETMAAAIAAAIFAYFTHPDVVAATVAEPV